MRVFGDSTNVNTNGWPSTEWTDSTREQREVTIDGQTYHFGMNERKNFMDEGNGAQLASQQTAPMDIEEDNNGINSRT